MAVDRSTWPTKAEVMEILRLSLGQVNNLIKAKRLEVRSRPRVGKPPVGIVNPDDVAREKELREARDTKPPHIMPKDAVVPASADANMLAGHPHNSAIARRFAVRAAARLPLPLWLHYDEAVIFTGLGESRLRELVAKGTVRTERGPHGAVVLCRTDLERLAEIRA